MRSASELLDGEVAVVTGAAGGMGSEVARTLSAAGAAIALCDVNASLLEHASLSLGDARQLTRCVDSADRSGFADFVADVTRDLGAITILVNCAGLLRRIVDYDKINEEEWNEVISANLSGTFVACACVGPLMSQGGRGSIVNFASTAGESGANRPAAHYAAAKGGVIAMSKSLARELSHSGVRVNVISPGLVDTPMMADISPQERESRVLETLVGRLGETADIAAAVLFLVGPTAGYINGEVLRVNGGSLI